MTRQPSSETSDQDRMSRFDTSIAHPARVYDALLARSARAAPGGTAQWLGGTGIPARRVSIAKAYDIGTGRHALHGAAGRVGHDGHMAKPPESTRTSLRQRLAARQGRAVTGVRGREVVAGQRAGRGRRRAARWAAGCAECLPPGKRTGAARSPHRGAAPNLAAAPSGHR